MTATIDRDRLHELLRTEDVLFAERHPVSRDLFEQAQVHLLDGVPMNWMTRWAGPFPLTVAAAQGASLTCVDGHTYVDFCLGDTGAMAGHSPEPTVRAVKQQIEQGMTTMLPSTNAVWVAEELARRFGLPYWQVAMTATDANRFALRIARHITGRPKVLVFDWCYHGSVDEALIAVGPDGVAGPRPGNVGPAVDVNLTTKVVEFNDVEALERALAPGDVAAVLTEPALTNIGIVAPEPGFHGLLRRFTREAGTLLVVDETHTICAGPGGYTRWHGLQPDMLTIGKAIGGGVPCAAYGFTQDIADRIHADWDYHSADVGGIGGTLAGSALQLAAMRATLDHVLNEGAFVRTVTLAERFAAGVQATIDELELPWIVARLGCRAEYWPCPVAPRNGAEAAAAEDPELDRFLHLFALNRGVLMTPFHNMALIAPATTEADVDRHTQVFREAAGALVG
jgi:glutamate-1-semialdehyde 2,1-aminomutase